MVSEEERQKLVEIAADESVFVSTALKIQDKMGSLIPFVFNREQVMLRNKVREMEGAGVPVRIIVLKARQIGFTTAIASMFYYRTIMQRNQNAMVVAHKADSARGILGKHKLFFDESPEFFRPMVKASNAREMLFENASANPQERKENPGLRSKIVIGTAGDQELGRSSTIHCLHLSELAFWPNANESFISVMQSVPNQPGTVVIIESTANGVGGVFYEEWQRAVRGESPFVPLFFPWWGHEEYTLRVPKDFVPDPEEEHLMKVYGLTAGQISWRRWCISANCHGSVDVFHQEYPSTPEEAFITSGRPVFDAHALASARLKAEDPKQKQIGNMTEISSGNDVRAVFQSQWKGPLKVWEPPEDGKEYVIGIDVSLGVKDGDYSCMQVVEKQSLRQVACWHGLVDPDELGRLAALLGRWYQGAMIVPEANSFGQMTIKALRRYHYPRIWRERRENLAESRVGMAYGLMTTTKTKPLMIGALQKYIREGAERIKDKNTISECLTYVVEDDNRKTNAQSGCHDDRVMALALAVYAATSGRYEAVAQQQIVEDWSAVYGSYSSTGY